MMAPAKPKMYPITAVITISTTAAIGSNGLTNYTGLIMCVPENEIEDRLRPAGEKENRPNHMPTGD
jgi:hypothetical protein